MLRHTSPVRSKNVAAKRCTFVNNLSYLLSFRRLASKSFPSTQSPEVSWHTYRPYYVITIHITLTVYFSLKPQLKKTPQNAHSLFLCVVQLLLDVHSLGMCVLPILCLYYLWGSAGLCCSSLSVRSRARDHETVHVNSGFCFYLEQNSQGTIKC